jgi:hypothetical protein
MDELTIDDEKYVSSKRAAEITGYAKDYVGQLAREGYVEAKRVGRSWYVLESAIREHRFGEARDHDANDDPSPKLGLAHEQKASIAPTWEPSTYTVETQEEIPSINVLHREERTHVPLKNVAAEPIEEAWQTWFEAHHAPVVSEGEASAQNGMKNIVITAGTDEPATNHVEELHLMPPSLPPTIPLRHEAPGVRVSHARRESPLDVGPRYIFTKVLLCVAMLACLTVVAAGSGVIDEYARMGSPVEFLSGISIYNKS